jgi:protoporphyrinogen oxidase
MYALGDIVRPTMSLNDESSPPEVAIVGAGLAGLSAALTLSRLAKHVRVSILEKESRIGGRVLTSDRPRGEHGAEFVLSSELVIVKLLRSLGVGRSASVGYGACRFEGRTGRGSFSAMARHTLSKESNQSSAAGLPRRRPILQVALDEWRSRKRPESGGEPGPDYPFGA